MHILAIGLNHTTAPVQMRERIVFGEEQVRTALSRLCCGMEMHLPEEMVIISTCNRVELYAVSPSGSFVEMERFLADSRGLSVNLLYPHLYHYADEEVVRHLFKVASGLDSLVLGEPQILGQVTRALELARGVGSCGPLLSRLFQAAIHAGKRSRTETSISRNPASVSSLAASLCEDLVSDIKSAHVVVLGAGEMAELAVEALRKRGAARLTVVNRTLERAEALASRWQAQYDTFENLEDLMRDADILISSTGAPHIIILPRMVFDAMQSRPARPLVMVDIAVPRDIDPDVTQVNNVSLYDIDNLNSHLEYSLAQRASQVPQVEAILEEETAKFMEYLGSLEMLPLISDMRQQAEAIRRLELEKSLRRMPDLTEAERVNIDLMTQALVKKLLAHPTNHLRAEAASPRATELASITRTLFNLQTGSNHGSHSGEMLHIFTAAD